MLSQKLNGSLQFESDIAERFGDPWVSGFICQQPAALGARSQGVEVPW